jgi:hypothetical protein
LYKHDTYDRRIQLGASRHRWEDAKALRSTERWIGAIYLAGYAIECSLKAWVCYYERCMNFKETKMFGQFGQGGSLHNLRLFLNYLYPLRAAIARNPEYAKAWNVITRMWQKDELRYWNKLGNKEDCEDFLEAVNTLHQFILRSQGE